MSDPVQAYLNRRQVLSRSAALGVAASAAFEAPWALAQPASEAAAEAAAPPLPSLGRKLQVPAIDLIGGGRFEPAQRAPKPLLIYWWASTCPFCALQSPHMQTLWREHAARFDFLGLSIDRTAQAAQQYLQSRGYSFPSGWASREWRAQFPKPRGLPITLVLDRQGAVVAAERGQMFPEDVADLKRFFV
jgi:thiol-disulfide isomerase/thioredoxin